MHARLFCPLVLLACLAHGCRQQPADARWLEEAAYRPSRSQVLPPSDTSTTEPALEVDLSGTPSLEAYLQYAALHNPGLKAAFNRWRAAVLEAPQVAALPDPRFTYRYFIEEVETRVGPQKHGLGLSQTIPWFGVLSLKEQAALRSAEAEHQAFVQARQELYHRVKTAYADLWELGRSIAIVDEHLKLAQHFERVVRARYRTAAADHPDMVRIQVELARLIDRKRSLEQLKPALAARLNAVLNRPAQTDVPLPDDLPSYKTELSLAELSDQLERTSPRLKSLDSTIERRRTDIDLAGKAYYPSFTVGLDYTDVGHSTAGRNPPDDGKDALVGMVSVNLPIWFGSLDAGVRQARHRYVDALATRRQAANDLVRRAAMSLYRLQDARRKLSLYRDTLLPKARESVKVHEAAFRGGTSSFLDLIDSQRLMLEFMLAAEQARAEQVRRIAELEMLVGAPLPKQPAESDAPDVSN